MKFFTKLLSQNSDRKDENGQTLISVWDIFQKQPSSAETKIRRSNYLIILFEGGLFIFGASFFNPGVLSVFVTKFTGSMNLAALPASMMIVLGSIGQLIVGPFLPKIKHLDKFLHRIYSSRFILLVIPLLLFLKLNSTFIVLMFFIIYGLFLFIDGFTVVPWTDIYTRTILPTQRGSLMGNRVVLGGLASTASGALIKWLLDSKMNLNTSYGFVFLLGAVTILSTIFVLYHLKDINETRPKNVKTVGVSAAFKRMFPLIKENHEFKKILVCRILISIGNMALPMSILFGTNVLLLTNSQTSTLIYIQILGTVFGGILWGQLSARIDNRMAVIVSFLMGALIPSIAVFLMVFHASLPATLIFILMIAMVLMTGMNIQAWLIGAYNYQLDIVPSADRAVSIMMTCIINIPLGLLMFLSGIIAEQIGFMFLMLLTLAVNVIGYFFSTQLIKRRSIPEYIKRMEAKIEHEQH